MIVTATADFVHERRKVRTGQQINVHSATARDLRAQGLVTWGGAAVDAGPLAVTAGESLSASPAAQAAPQTTLSGSADGDLEPTTRRRRRKAEADELSS
jgi:hypothetical protein